MTEDHAHVNEQTPAVQKKMFIIFILTALFMVMEFVVGIISNSLALLADSGHMLSDVMSLALSVFALIIAQRPRNPRYTYGYYRAEVLAALINGLSLIVISGLIVSEAIHRLSAERTVLGGPMLIAAILGLLINVYGLIALKEHQHENLNVSSAFFHIAADLLGSVAAIVAGILIIVTGNPVWDVIISLLITVLIVISGIQIIMKAGRILMQRAPEHMDSADISSSIQIIEKVENVHDLHIWAIDNEKVLLTAHVEVSEGLCQHDRQEVMRTISHLMADKYHIEHTTIQIEHPDPLLKREDCGCL